MKIAIASGKGGTGKTTVATNLAFVAQRQGRSVAYVDCDVEEPNGHLFLRPAIGGRQLITRPVAEVDKSRCNACGRCELVCQFSAIVRVGKNVLTYPQLCHGCGVCMRACPRQAIGERAEPLGWVEVDATSPLRFAQGTLDLGQPQATGLIRAVKSAAPDAELMLFDAPPGTSCSLVQTVRGMDRVLLVAEPTPFGAHDFALVLQTVRKLALPVAAVINRCDWGNGALRQLCREQAVPILAELPEDSAIGRVQSEGALASEKLPQYEALFARLLSALTEPWPPSTKHVLEETCA